MGCEMGWDFSNLLDDEERNMFTSMDVEIYAFGKFNPIHSFWIDPNKYSTMHFHLDVPGNDDVYVIWNLYERHKKSFIYSLWGYKIEDNGDAMLEFVKNEAKWHEYDPKYFNKVIKLIEKLQS